MESKGGSAPSVSFPTAVRPVGNPGVVGHAGFWIPAFAGMTVKGANMQKTYWVYILASRRNGTLYVGVTNDLARRAYEHRTGMVAGFTKRYAVKSLVWYEAYADIREAIAEEKRLKGWERAWKLRLIETGNPGWKDLYDDLNR